jgi:type III secretion system YscD/HrpQ family protein
MGQEDGRREIVLKIFSGLHQGSCIPLREDTYSMGKDESCDFILNDDEIGPKHLVLFHEEEQWFFQPVDGKVFIKGRLGDDRKNPLMQREIVTIGPVHFALMDKSDDWRPARLPELEDPGIQTVANQNARKPFKPRIVWLKTLKILATGVAVVLIYWVSQGVIPVRKPDYGPKLDEIREIVNASPLTGSTVSLDKDGYIEVIGYAPNLTIKKEMRQKLGAQDVLMRTTLYAEDEIEQAAESYLARMHYPLRATYEGRGKINLKGVAWDSQEMAKIREDIKTNVPGVTRVQVEMQPLCKMKPAIEKVIQESHLDHKLSVRPSPDGLEITGELTPEEQETWLQNKNKVIVDMDSAVKIIDNIKHLAEKTAKPGKIVIPVTSVSLGERPYVTLEGGRKCFEGGPLKAGSIISRITSDKIIVQIQGRDYYYAY